MLLHNDMWKDFRYAARVLAASPGFSLIVILSLALAIGANTSIFSVVNAFLLRPMPVDHPDRLLDIYVTAPNLGNNLEGFSYPQWQDFSREDTGLSDIVGFNGAPLSVTDGEKPELIWGEMVTANYFSGLGVHPALGRGFLPDEEQAAKPVCVLNYSYWQRRFHGDPEIAGKTIRIEGHPFTIVGVAGKGFIGANLFNFIPDLWVPDRMQKTIAPAAPDLTQGRDNRWMNVRARLKPGVTPKQAEAALNIVARRLAGQYPVTDRDRTVHVMYGGARMQPWLYTLGLIPMTTAIVSGVVILVLLIACANVANLMLARGTSRAREMGIRLAIGATRWRLVRQLLAESVLLSLAGAVGGIVFTVWFNDLSLRFYPKLDFDTMDLADATRLDPRMFVFAVALSLIAAVLFGLFPAFRASRTVQIGAIKGSDAAQGRFSSGNALVMLQVALSCLLLVVGGLFLRSMQFAGTVDPGFRRTGITLFSVNLDLQHYDDAQSAAFERKMMDQLRALPGVEDAAFAFPLPLDAYNSAVEIYPEGLVPDREQNVSGMSRVSPHYFDTMGTQIIAGRALDDRDTAQSKSVALINQTVAQRFWGSPQAALGRRFAESKGGPLIEVVGVARNGKYFSFGEPATPYVFLPISQSHPAMLEVLIRSDQDIAGLMPAVRREIGALDPALPLFGVRTMPQFLNRTVSVYQMGASVIGMFAVMALLLAGVGIYGVLHFTVARRTKEIGIRMALGARYTQVLRMVLERSLLWVAAGLAVGIGLALSARGITGSLVAGVTGSDPLTLAAAILIFLAIVVSASIIPARRAARVDPLHALRHE